MFNTTLIRKTVSYTCFMAVMVASAPLYAADKSESSIEINLDVLTHSSAAQVEPKSAEPAKPAATHAKTPAVVKKHTEAEHKEKPAAPKKTAPKKAAAPAHEAATPAKPVEKPAEKTVVPIEKKALPPELTPSTPELPVAPGTAVIPSLPQETKPIAPEFPVAPDAKSTPALPGTPAESKPALPPELAPSTSPKVLPPATGLEAPSTLPSEAKPAPPTAAPGMSNQLSDFMNGKPATPELPAPAAAATPMGLPLSDSKLESPTTPPKESSAGMSLEGLPALPAEAPKSEAPKLPALPAEKKTELPLPTGDKPLAEKLPEPPATKVSAPALPEIKPLAPEAVLTTPPAEKAEKKSAPEAPALDIPPTLPTLNSPPSAPPLPSGLPEKPSSSTLPLPSDEPGAPLTPAKDTTKDAKKEEVLPDKFDELLNKKDVFSKDDSEDKTKKDIIDVAPIVAKKEEEKPSKTAVLPELVPLPENVKGDRLALPSGRQSDLLEKTPKATDIARTETAELAAKAREEDPDVRLVFNETETDVPSIMYGQLDSLAQRLAQTPNAKANIISYSGTKKETGIYPKRVSLARGIAVRNYLTTTKGIDIERVTVRALGNKSEGGPTERVDVFILAQ